MDWLGAIGGVDNILMKFTIWIFGGFLQFNSTIVTMVLSKDPDCCEDCGNVSINGNKPKNPIELLQKTFDIKNLSMT